MTVQDWLGTDNSLGVNLWERKYRRNNESFDEWLDRVSGGDDDLRRLIVERKFLFGGRALSNRGTPIKEGSLFNCYSAGFAPDDTDGLLELNRQLGVTYKAQGGQGVSLTKLRPKGTPVGSRFQSDGIVPFMEIFNTTTSQISQGGARKGALMISLDVRHKEAEEFITIKSELGKIEKANLSLEIDDDFMKAVEAYYKSGEEIVLHEKREYSGHMVEYDIIPIKLYKLMIQTAYEWGEPGCLFVNQFRNRNLMEFVDGYIVETCNPCGEQPLGKSMCCNLGSLNLSEYIINPYTQEAEFDYGAFSKDIYIAVRALDDILDENIERHPLPEQSDNSIKWRNIGLGVMGYATALLKMGITYGSDIALAFTELLFGTLFNQAVDASCRLADERGAFPGYDKNVWESEILKNQYTGNNRGKELRNCSLVSIAPTGSISSLLGGISGGCEPEFALSYTRKTESLNGGKAEFFEVFCNAANEYMQINNTNRLPDWFVSSADINWVSRINTQSVMQRYVDTAISSTVNLPKETTVAEIEQLYLYAWQQKLKGITIFRDGCKRLGILTTEKSETEDHPVSVDLPRGFITPKSDDLIGKLRTLTTGCGSLHCTAFFDPFTGDFVHTFLSKGSTGGCANFTTGLSRMISLAARGGIDLPTIVDQLNSCGSCSSYAVRSATKRDTSKGACCPMAIGNALLDMWKEMRHEIGVDEDERPAPKKEPTPVPQTATRLETRKKAKNPCPVCKSELVFEGGCNLCKNCGWSRCS